MVLLPGQQGQQQGVIMLTDRPVGKWLQITHHRNLSPPEAILQQVAVRLRSGCPVRVSQPVKQPPMPIEGHGDWRTGPGHPQVHRGWAGLTIRG